MANTVQYINRYPCLRKSIVCLLNYLPGLKRELKWSIRRTCVIRPEVFEMLKAAERRNCDNHTDRQLFIDISQFLWIDIGTGIQRVVRNILKQFIFQQSLAGFRIELVSALQNCQGYFYVKSLWSDEKKYSVPAGENPIYFKDGDIFLGLDLAQHAVTENDGFYQKLRNQGVLVKFIVYDILPVLLPEHFPHNIPDLHESWLKVIARTDGAICISKAVADDLEQWLTARSLLQSNFRINWFHLGAGIESNISEKKNFGAENFLNMAFTRPSFLMVGTLEPRKGYAQVLAAFELLWAKGVLFNLVIVGKRGWMTAELIQKMTRHSEWENRLFWIESASDEHLDTIYVKSVCLIAASYGEGFGLPLIEAAQHKLPIIARDIPVFREVAGESALYFSGKDAESLASAIEGWLILQAQGAVPDSGNISRLTWKKSADILIEKLKY